MKLLLTFPFLFFLLSFSLCNAQNKIIQLPAPDLSQSKSLLYTLQHRASERNFDTLQLSQQELSNLLWAAYGVNRKESGKRTVPSAMNRQNINLYVFLPQGIFRYDGTNHSLVQISDKDCRTMTGTQEFVKKAATNFVYTAKLSAFEGIGDEEKIIFSSITVGCIVQNVHLYCASAGLGSVARASMQKSELSKLLQLPEDEKIILAQSIGFPEQ